MTSGQAAASWTDPSPDVPHALHSSFCPPTIRFGEAAHPGPDDHYAEPAIPEVPPRDPSRLRIGCSNPSGFNGKELTALQLGCGIWCYSETHLTSGLQRFSTAILSKAAERMNRHVRAHFGGPVPYRSHSSQAGTWSGVGVLSDFPSREINVAWQRGERSSGRLILTRHLINQLPFMVATCYGFPAGPTWPQARQLTSQLLSVLSQEVVISGSRPRVIAGDFNSTIDQQDEFRLWQSYGWQEIQILANQHWQRPITPTCKGATVVDMMWLLPEAIMLCRNVDSCSTFSEHATLYADFEVHLWFRQLRRHQSYKHSALANKQTVNAEAYRLNLWTSIKRGRGFDGLFDSWWPRRQHQSQHAPASLPLATFQIIFLDLQRNFQSFERWHLRQRRKILRLKHARSCLQLFKELRPPQRGQLDLLWHSKDYTILALDLDGRQLHLDQSLGPLDHQLWFINSTQVDIQSVDDDVITLRSLPSHVEVGDVLQCHQYYSTTDQLQQALLELWQPRWQRASQIGSEQWDRITGFIQAYMPPVDFPEPELNCDQWHTALSRFPPRPARGVDGIDVQDLKHLPETITTNLLQMLKSIDGERCHWPDQLLYGTVLSLSKQDQAHLPTHYRPVVILGTVYRTWSRMCALPLLQALSRVVPASAHGFLPGRECVQVWLQLLCFIETCLQQGCCCCCDGSQQ
eukprot:s1291_g2.t1